MEFFDTSQLPANLAKRSFTAGILRLRPNGNAPLFALSGLAKTKKCLDTVHAYWTKTSVFPDVTVGAQLSAAATTFVVVSTATIMVGSVLRFKSSGDTTSPENVLVTSITNATTFVVIRGHGGTTAQIIPAASILPEIGTSFEQGSSAPSPRAILPIRHINQTQIFRDGWGNSRTLKAVQLEVGDGTTSENKRDAKFFHAGSIEKSTFFAVADLGTVPTLNGRPITTMDGIESIISKYAPANVIAAGSTTTFNQLESYLDPLLDTTSDASMSNTRTIYVGKGALKVINDIGKLSGEYQVDRTETSFGQRFHSFSTTRGDFQVIEHPIFNTNAEWIKMAVVMELSAFDFMYLRPTEHRDIDQAGRDSEGGVITTELTVELRNPFACGIIYNLTAAA
tara:strand:- start:1022 stop:2206 length:1185 start_codon:yes stop_codon:yes gene_type:complete